MEGPGATIGSGAQVAARLPLKTFDTW